MYPGAKRNATPRNGRQLFSFFFPSIDRLRTKTSLDETTKNPQTSLAAPEFIYVRVKRRAATYFLRVEPTERVRSLKLKLEEIVQRGPEEIRLLKLLGGGASGGGGGGRSGGSDAAAVSGAAASISRQDPLDDEDARLADVGIGNDDVLALCFKEGSSGWEKVEIFDDGISGGGGGTTE